MATARFAWGIDVGNRGLKAVKLVRDGDGFRVDDFEFIEHETFLSQSGDNREALITSALDRFVKAHPQKGGVAAISVSGQQSFARFIKLPPVEPKKIPEIVRFEAIQQIPFPLDDVEWSYQLFQSPDSPEVEVGIFAMRKELIARHVGFYTDQDINVQAVQMSPLAVYNAMWHDQRIDGTTMIVDLGAENTDLIIADGETVWLRSIPIGGNNFTEALSKAFKVDFRKAEEMKRTAGTSKYVRQIMQAMRPVFADLVAEIQRSVGFYASVHRDARIKKIVALGGTFKLPGLQKYLQQNLQLDVERIDSVVAQPPGDAKVAANFNDHLLSSVGAYGLALQAMGEAKITSSLLPSAIRSEQLWRSKTKWFAAAAALFVVGTGVGYGSWYTQRASYDAQQQHRDEIARIQGRAQELEGKWSTATAVPPELKLVENVRSLTAMHTFWPQLLTEIQQAVPKPQPELLSGKVDVIKKIPRPERRELVIQLLSGKYMPDIGLVLADPDIKRFADTGQGQPQFSMPQFTMPTAAAPGGMMGEMAPEDMGMMAAPMPVAAATPNAAAGKAGFLITIRGTTPSKDKYALVDEFVNRLAALNVGKDRKYYVAHATTVNVQKVGVDQQRMTELQNAYANLQKARTNPTSGGGFAFNPGGFGGMETGDMGMMAPEDMGAGAYTGGGFVGGVPQPGQPDMTLPFKDRLFPEEDVREDWGFTVLFAVALGPPPEQPAPAPAPTSAAEAGAQSGADAAPAAPAGDGTAAPAAPAAPAAAPAPGADGTATPPPAAPAAPATDQPAP